MAGLKAQYPHYRRGIRVVVVGSVIGLVPAGALANPPPIEVKVEEASSSDREEEAKKAFFRALALVDKKKYKEALVDLERAQHLAPNFRILYNIGFVKLKLEDVEGAYAALSAFVETGGSRIPRDQLAVVLKELERIKPQLSWLRIEVDDDHAEVALDGEVIAPEQLSNVLYVRAGERKVTVRFGNGRREERSFVGTAGQQTVLRFETPVLPPPAAERRKTRRDPTSTNRGADAADARPFPWEPWAVTGVLGAGGAVLGLFTLRERENEKALQATRGVTKDELQGVHTKVKRLALATDVTLGLAAVSAAVSIYWTVEWSSDKERTEIRASVDPSINGIRIEGKL